MKNTVKTSLKILARFFELTLIFSGVVVACYILIIQTPEVVGESMAPTLKNREMILAEKITLRYTEPKRGDILIFRHPEEENIVVIKRVVGLPGERFKLSGGKIYINDSVLNEDYTNESTATMPGTFIVDDESVEIPENNYLMLGDNRKESFDSRFWGFVSKDKILGKAVLVYKPINGFRLLD